MPSSRIERVRRRRRRPSTRMVMTDACACFCRVGERLGRDRNNRPPGDAPQARELRLRGRLRPVPRNRRASALRAGPSPASDRDGRVDCRVRSPAVRPARSRARRPAATAHPWIWFGGAGVSSSRWCGLFQRKARPRRWLDSVVQVTLEPPPGPRRRRRRSGRVDADSSVAALGVGDGGFASSSVNSARRSSHLIREGAHRWTLSSPIPQTAPSTVIGAAATLCSARPSRCLGGRRPPRRCE